METEVGVRSGNGKWWVMNRLRDCADITAVREVFKVLRHDREITCTAVMSTMDNTHRTEWSPQQRCGKAYGYWPSPTRDAYSSLPMLDALGRGRRSDVVRACFPNQITDDALGAPRMLLRRVATRGQTS